MLMLIEYKVQNFLKILNESLVCFSSYVTMLNYFMQIVSLFFLATICRLKRSVFSIHAQRHALAHCYVLARTKKKKLFLLHNNAVVIRNNIAVCQLLSSSQKDKNWFQKILVVQKRNKSLNTATHDVSMCLL